MHVKALAYLEKIPEKRVRCIQCGHRKGASVLELVNLFIRTTGAPLPFVIARRPGDVEKVYVIQPV